MTKCKALTGSAVKGLIRNNDDDDNDDDDIMQVYRVLVMWTVDGRPGRHGRRAVSRVPVESSGDSAPARPRSRQAPARTASGLATTPGRVTSTRVTASGRAGRSWARARGPAAREALDSDDERVIVYLASQSVAMETTRRRYLVTDR